RAASGHAVAPPRRVMNSRRLMGLPVSRGSHPTTPPYEKPRCASQQTRTTDVSVGSFSGITAAQQQRPLHLNKQTLQPPTLVHSGRWENYPCTTRLRLRPRI